MAKTSNDSVESLPKLKECFIITPIGDARSSIRDKAMGLIISVITPVLLSEGYKPVAAHNLPDSGSINHQIINKILECDLVIANLTGLNPNVMYELAIRHAARLPVITMMEKGDTSGLPFDLVDQRTIFYEDSLMGSEQAKLDLTAFVESALKVDKPNNPIYAATAQETIFKEKDVADPIKSLIAKVDYLTAQITPNNSVSKANKTKYTDFKLFHIVEEINFIAVPSESNSGVITFDDYDDMVDDLRGSIEMLGNMEFMKLVTIDKTKNQFQLQLSFTDGDSLYSLLKYMKQSERYRIIE
ncbi:nucleoside 2-deoxyribosyltransferase [Pedobacter sp. Leaf250]|uniref:nucleoside 2-deoxyribosyltransferase n=1 Tax=Pedobacter sp. Leaf250 TaxID=2876559 RepID=UPI001E547405|nr:nucleoside 2-deoxyribosyltransferase [Pedobacter sp. Leaf250]